MSAVVVTIADETPKETLREFQLELVSERITVRDLIRRRVRAEVDEYNRTRPAIFRGLVQPTGAERVLNGFKLPKQRTVDSEVQAGQALEAFERNGFLLLVNDKQVETLDDEIFLRPGTRVSFLKLVPLVGG